MLKRSLFQYSGKIVAICGVNKLKAGDFCCRDNFFRCIIARPMATNKKTVKHVLYLDYLDFEKAGRKER